VERDFFAAPFTDAELRDLLNAVRPAPNQGPAASLFSWKSPSAKHLGLTPQTASDADLLRLMLSEPRLIRRPITRIGDTLIVGADYMALEKALG